MTLTETERFIPFPDICRAGGWTTFQLQRACDHHKIPVTQLVPGGKRMLSEADYEKLLSKAKGGKRD